MKNILKSIGLLALIVFSFFYTDKVMNVVNNQDEIMIKLKSIEDNYKIEAIDATISDDTIVPGINGRVLDVEKTYKYLKQVGVVDESLFKYKVVSPKVSLSNNIDKYITKANPKKDSVAILITLNSKTNLNKVLSVANSKKAKINFFIEYNYLMENIAILNELKEHEVYSYIPYSPDTLIISNNIIKNKMDNEPIYCLASTKDIKVLNICSSSNMYTILPSIIGGYTEIKSSLENGSIILLSNDKITNELDISINYIKNKGYNISGLSSHISE